MEVEKFFKWSILDELFESKNEQFTKKILKELREQNKKLEDGEAQEKVRTKIKEFITDEKKQKALLNELDNYEYALVKTNDFWKNMFYKLGAYDSADIKSILPNYKTEKSIFLDDLTDDFMDYLESNRMEILRKREDYRTLEDKMNKIKEDNPQVRCFVDNRDKVKLTEKEQEKVLEILNLQGDLETLEYKETFKLGAKEMILFLRQMGLL